MTLRSLFGVTARFWVVIAVTVVAAAGAVFATASVLPKEYAASTQQYVGFNGANSPNQLAQGATYTQGQMQSFGLLATSPAVLDPVIRELGLATDAPTLQQSITVTTPRNTVVLQIEVLDRDPNRAAAIANAVASQLVTTVRAIGPVQTNGRPQLTISTIASAVPPVDAERPKIAQDTVLGAVVGLIIGVAIALALSARQATVRTRSDVAATVAVPYVGGVVDTGRRAPDTVVIDAPASPAAEDFRRMRVAIRLSGDDTARTLLIAGADRAAGATTAAANLAAVMSESGHSVVLVDLDLRRGRLAQLLGTRAEPGASDILVGSADLEGVLQRSRGGFDLLAAGSIRKNPGELISKPGLARLLQDLRERYDQVVVDCPSISTAADALFLGTQLDQVVVIARAGRTTTAELSAAVQQLQRAGARVCGVSLNRVAERGPALDPWPVHESA